VIGRALGDVIERSLGFYEGYFARRGIASSDLPDLVAPFVATADAGLPDLMETIRGMAEGAMVSFWQLFAVNAFEELEWALDTPGFAPDRCSSFVVTGEGTTLLGHNEQWFAGDAGNLALVVDVGQDGDAAVSPTVACCLPAVGMNARGGAQAIDSLPATGDRPGIPRVLVSRHSLDARDQADAVARAAFRARAGGYAHTFAFKGGAAFVVETTAEDHSVLSGPGPHTNHYLDPALGELAPQPSAGTVGRYDRLLALLEELRPDTPQGAMRVLKDHESRPQAICLHPDERDGDDAEAVLFSMVCDLETPRMWVAPGPPCTTPYEEIDLTDIQ
jgi:isopenicillin-N N-acyltransferase-like protein